MAASLGFPFTNTQWKELERQAMIYNYITASVPVPPQFLIPTPSNAKPLNIFSFFLDEYSWFGGLFISTSKLQSLWLIFAILSTCSGEWIECKVLKWGRSRTREV